MYQKNSYFHHNISYHIILLFFMYSFMGFGCNYSKKPFIINDKDIRPPQKILLITIDTLRADHLGCYGYSEIRTPSIDSLAREGVRFEWAFTPAPITLPSHVSILTGLYPYTHGVLNNGEYRLSASIKRLPEIFQEQGFSTAAFVGAFVLSKQFGLARGFEVYGDELATAEEKVRHAFSLYNDRRAEKVTEDALHWLKKNPQRFFLWVHYFDPHTPYDPPQPFKSEYKDRPYDGEIAYTDHCLGLLIQELENQNVLQDTLVILVADHGESLGEHKESTHGIFLYDATMRVPLIMRYPGLPTGTICSQQVSTLDIMPSILEIVNIPLPPGLQGISLLTHLYPSDLPMEKNTDIFLETRFPEANFGWCRLQGLRTRRWKYIKAPRPELYDLQTDSQELHNIAHRNPQQTRYLEKKLQALLNTLSPTQENNVIPMKEETRRRLESLGYVWTVDSSGSTPLPADPKDMIEVLNLFDQGSDHYDKGQYPEAISSFRTVIQKNPQNILARFLLAAALEKIGNLEESMKEFQQVASQKPQFINVHNNIGTLYENLGEYEKALHEYQTDIRLHPDSPLSYNNLGVIFLIQKRYSDAKEQFKKVLTLEPDRPTQIVAHANLGIAYEMLGIYDLALEEYQSSLTLDPAYLLARMGAGNIFLKTNQPEKAIQSWQKALENHPQNAEAHFNLGCTFLKQRNLNQAIEHLQKAIRLEPNLWQARMLLQKIQNQPAP